MFRINVEVLKPVVTVTSNPPKEPPKPKNTQKRATKPTKR